ncbi:MAG TPA: hypothetical protein VFS43_17495 [Polyangiaceae bacterium]|nr:hypothetical protein [Polyangiaceae bacterium]
MSPAYHLAGRWARVGASNLNVASWLGNAEIDVAIDDEPFAGRMQAQFERDLGGATEVVLERRLRRRRGDRGGGRPRGGRAVAAAGALRIASTVGAAMADRRVLGAGEGKVLLGGAAALAAVAVLGLWWPRALAWPLAPLAAWSAVGLLSRYLALARGAKAARSAGR